MIRFFKHTPDAVKPSRSHPTDAGLDLRATEDVFIPVGSTALIKTSLSIEVPEGWVGKIDDRSSMAAKGLIVGGGVVDALYNGELSVILHNFSNKSDARCFGFEKGYQVKKGDKIAQMLLYRVNTADVVETKEIWTGPRGNKALGSSGR